MARITASSLRQDIYRILDQVLETGVPVEIERRGSVLRITPAEPVERLSNLTTRDCLRGDPEELVHADWSGEWRPSST